METRASQPFWWLKSGGTVAKGEEKQKETADLTSKTAPTLQLELDISSSLADFLDKERDINEEGSEDIESIIDEINRVAAQSPLGPYPNEKANEERSVEEIMKEAERIYMESSKSFEQLSSRSKTSVNVTELRSNTNSKQSTPTPKSVSPLPLDDDEKEEKRSKTKPGSDEGDCYSEDFSEESRNPSPTMHGEVNSKLKRAVSNETFILNGQRVDGDVIQSLQDENRILKEDIMAVKMQLQETSAALEQARAVVVGQKSPEIDAELERALEELKDTRETNTALQLQLDTLNKTHHLLKQSHEELLSSNRNLERRVSELDTTLAKYKNELSAAQKQRDRLAESEAGLGKQLEIEKLQAKSLRLQNEKDARCIQDLNRQIKEMERIIARKHPDSVSALIVAAKSDASESNMSARKLLEDRIKTLEQEAVLRDSQSSKVFLEVQDKFSQMKLKYESHIEDLELHVSDLKSQLKRKGDTYDVYTQTCSGEQLKMIPEKETANRASQTDPHLNQPAKNPVRKQDKEETHLLATIRGLKADLANKEKVISKLNRDVDEARKTNRRLQKEREGSLRNLNERREFRSYPEKLALQGSGGASENGDFQEKLEEELRNARSERNKLRDQLCKMEEDYRALKNKRLQDLNALQEAHEREIMTYVSNVTPLREQLEVQQVSLTALQTQLSQAKEDLAIVTIERDHLNNRLSSCVSGGGSVPSLANFQSQNGAGGGGSGESATGPLLRKIAYLEKRYEEREIRLRAIVHGLAQKNITNKSCEQCAARQQQLIGYKAELDQILATLRTLQ